MIGDQVVSPDDRQATSYNGCAARKVIAAHRRRSIFLPTDSMCSAQQLDATVLALGAASACAAEASFHHAGARLPNPGATQGGRVSTNDMGHAVLFVAMGDKLRCHS